LIDSNLTITVLGTSFHVNTIDETYVVVESGKVSVSNGSQSVLLETGERADLQNGTLIASANTDVNLLSWKTGILKFSNTPLSHVYSDLARHYHCEFTYATQNTEVPQFNLTGTYQDMTLQETLQTIELTIPQVHYECSDSKVLVNYQK
jgi:ferric-dicitrate binding protein FerR (iron transport regulator)